MTQTLDTTLGDIRAHAGILLDRDKHSGTAAITLGLVALSERLLRTEREEALSRITALRLALRDIADLADASEPISVQANRYATEALAADDLVVRGARGGP